MPATGFLGPSRNFALRAYGTFSSCALSSRKLGPRPGEGGDRGKPGASGIGALQTRFSAVHTEAGQGANPDRFSESRPPIDLEHLRRYTLGDPMLEDEVLQLFYHHAAVTLAQVVRPSGAQARRDAAHALLGSARAVGAWGVATLAEAIQSTDRDIDTLVARLERAVDSARGFIRARRKGTPGS